MPLVTITYNASTGSDTAASGSGPATAVTGTSATNGTGNVVNLDGTPDLSGVAVNDVIWVNSATTNRHLSRITAVDDGADTVTTEDLLVLSTGVSWAIGGKRQGLENDTGNRDLEDGLGGWLYELETGTYVLTTTRHIISGGNVTDGPVMLHAASGATATVSWSYLNFPFSVTGRFDVRDLTLSGSSSNTANRCFNTISGLIRAVRCTLVAGNVALTNGGDLQFFDCDISTVSGGGIGINASTGRNRVIISGCFIHDCGTIGLDFTSITTRASYIAVGNAISNCGEEGIAINGALDDAQFVIAGNTIHGCTRSGIEIIGVLSSTDGPISIYNNILTANGRYGIEAINTGIDEIGFVDFNAFGSGVGWANTSGALLNLTAGTDDVTLGDAVDPYTDSVNDDYTLNNTAGGGAACKDAGLGYNGP